MQVFTWGSQNLKLLMIVLQCNIVRQMLCILEGLIPLQQPEEAEDGPNAGKEGADGNY